ncbi:MAG TPA: HEPN domain-containing protein [Longimicrobium sp.]
MTDRIDNLLSAGMAARQPASDEEIVGVWKNAVKAYGDARLAEASSDGRVVRAYDSARLASHGLVRSRDLKARGQNHHEITLTLAAIIGGEEFERALREVNELRKIRNTLEYGWEEASRRDAERAVATVEKLLGLAAENLRAHRPDLAERISSPV